MWWILILDFIFGLGAAFLATTAALSFVTGIKSRKWPVANGEILSSEVNEWLSEPGWAGDFYDRGGAECYSTEIIYKYSINNSDYYSNRIDAHQVTGGDQGKSTPCDSLLNIIQARKQASIMTQIILNILFWKAASLLAPFSI